MFSPGLPGVHEPSRGSFAPAVLCNLPSSVLEIFKTTFSDYVPVVRIQVAFQPAYQLERER